MPKIIYDIETTGLEPWNSEIAVISIKHIEKNQTLSIHKKQKTEKQIVEQFLEWVDGHEVTKAIGYNIPFDDRFIFAKALEYKVDASYFFSDQCYHVDLLNYMKTPKNMPNMNKPGGLDDWVVSLFGEEKLEENGDVPGLIEDGELDRVVEYCEKDVELTYRLWKRLRQVLKRPELE